MTDPWADDGDQLSFADLFDADERRAWAARRRCKHCYVWGRDERSGKFFIACAHGCGSIRHMWDSPDPDGDYRRMKDTQEAFRIAHRNGCPRDIGRETRVKPWKI